MDNAAVAPGDNGQVSVNKSSDELQRSTVTMSFIFRGGFHVHSSAVVMPLSDEGRSAAC